MVYLKLCSSWISNLRAESVKSLLESTQATLKEQVFKIDINKWKQIVNVQLNYDIK